MSEIESLAVGPRSGGAPRCQTVSVTEAASVLGISRTSAYECVKSGALPSIRLRGRILISTLVLDEMLGAGL